NRDDEEHGRPHRVREGAVEPVHVPSIQDGAAARTARLPPRREWDLALEQVAVVAGVQMGPWHTRTIARVGREGHRDRGPGDGHAQPPERRRQRTYVSSAPKSTMSEA